MSDYIKREDAVKIVDRCKDRLTGRGSTYEIMLSMFNDEHFAPSADVIPKDYYEKVVEELIHRHTEREAELYDLKSERKHGEWKKVTNPTLGICLQEVYICSVCGIASGCQYSARRSFCPNCGARMKGADDE